MEPTTARVRVVFNEISRRWESRVTFDVPPVFEGQGVQRDGLTWPYWRCRSRFRRRVVLKTVRELLRTGHKGSIEIVSA